MKAFDLDLYNQNVKEGKTPKLVTRSGQSVRLVCVDRNSDPFTMVGLVDKIWRESVTTYTKEGYFEDQPGSDLDLFFADPEPTYRPYKDAEEFLKAQKEHGSYLLACGQNLFPSLVDDKCIVTVSTSGAKAWTYSEVLDVFVWRDKSPCGVKEE